MRLLLGAGRRRRDPLLRDAGCQCRRQIAHHARRSAGVYAQQNGLAQAPALHPLQQAFIDVQAVHCGYCYNGMTIKGAELLAQNPKPTDVQIRAHMDGHLCRCGAYPRVMKAIKVASARIAGETR
jgi:xanthine dehydrogenase iron-sulfur cluster and FAD-binding subunit A